MVALWLASLAWSAECETVLDIALKHVEASFRGGDPSGVQAGLRDARANLGCLTLPVDPTLAARIHRAEALGAQLAGGGARADATLRAMVHADPWLGVGDLVPPGDPLAVRLVYVEEGPPPTTRPLLWPEAGHLQVDGIPAAVAPSDQPWVYQQLTKDGTVLATAWIDVGAAPPPPVGAVGERAVKRNGYRVAGLTLAAIGGGLAGGAVAQNQRYNDALVAQDPVAARDLRSSTTSLTIGAIATGAAGATLLVVGFAL